MYFDNSEHCDQGKDAIEKGTGIGDQQLLLLHLESGDKQLGAGESAPGDSGGRGDVAQHAGQGEQDRDSGQRHDGEQAVTKYGHHTPADQSFIRSHGIVATKVGRLDN